MYLFIYIGDLAMNTTLNVKIWGSSRKDCFERLSSIYEGFVLISESPIIKRDGTLAGITFEISLIM